MYHPVVIAVIFCLTLMGAAQGLKKPSPPEDGVEAVVMTPEDAEEVYRAGASSVKDRLDSNGCLRGSL